MVVHVPGGDSSVCKFEVSYRNSRM